MIVQIKRGYRRVVSKLEYSVDPNKSAIVDLRGAAVSGLFIPTIDTGNVTFEVADSKDATPVALKDKDGLAVSIIAGTGGFAVSTDDLSPLAGYRYARVVCAGNQLADREFIFTVKT